MIGKILENKKEAKDVSRLIIGLNKEIHPKPGQYLIVSLQKYPEIKRAYSIVLNDKNSITLGVKKIGIMSNRLCSIKKNSELILEGPYGKFCLLDDNKVKVLIAGGIGITPFIPMLYASKNAVLFYSVKFEEQASFTKELENFKDRVFYRYTSIDGHLSVEDIEKRVKKILRAEYYICGPKKMRTSFKEQLISKGVSEDQIKSEEFENG